MIRDAKTKGVCLNGNEKRSDAENQDVYPDIFQSLRCRSRCAGDPGMAGCILWRQLFPESSGRIRQNWYSGDCRGKHCTISGSGMSARME